MTSETESAPEPTPKDGDGSADREAAPKPPEKARTKGKAAGAEAAKEPGAAAASRDESKTKQPGKEPPATSFSEWVRGRPLPRELTIVFGLIMPSVMLALNLLRVRAFTIDDAYISFRYARNLSRGLGLVYNAGERIEGYTNFLWTVILAGGISLGIDPDALSKLLGAASAFGALYFTYVLSERMRSFRSMPCIATWMLASTIVFTGWAVFGLETIFFVFLILAGLVLFLRETGPQMRGPEARRTAPLPTAFPWSGVVFALAGLTRPEAPMYVGIPMLFLGRRFFQRQNLIRGAIFTAPVAAHMVFRRLYYDTWLPNTLAAKTGNLDGQLHAGWAYLENWLQQQSSLVWLALFGVAIGIVLRRFDMLAIAALAAGVAAYILVVGGDWMPHFRFMAGFEPFCFLLVDLGVRSIVDKRERAPIIALGLFSVAMIPLRLDHLHDSQTQVISKDKAFWDKATGGTATWFLEYGEPGEIAIGDIGFIGYTTDYPILDLLGLVDPEIAKMPGGYTQKLGPAFKERFFDAGSKYVLIISASLDCMNPSVAGSRVLFSDARFHQRYELTGKVPLDAQFAWCIWKNKSVPRDQMAAPVPHAERRLPTVPSTHPKP